jgi:hypothetical protein
VVAPVAVMGRTGINSSFSEAISVPKFLKNYGTETAQKKTLSITGQ